jgi:hypothetical protein
MCMSVIVDEVWIDELDVVTTHTYNSELQAITALSPISTIYKSLHAKSSPACCVSISRCLATASNSGDSSASRTHVVIVWRIFRN